MSSRLLEIFNEVEKYHWWFEGRRILLSKLIKSYFKKSDLMILDIGCGTGANIDFLSSYGKVYGVDNVPIAVNFCKSKGYKRIKNASAHKLPFRDGIFDLVTILDVLEHVEEDDKALAEAKRVLRKNGKIIITSPAIPFIWSDHDVMQGHYRRYTSDRIREISKKNKLFINQLSYYNVLLAVPIITIRLLSNLNMFKRFANYDSSINFDIAKITPVNNLLLGLIKLEFALGDLIRYPFGISIIGVLSKR